MKMYKAIIAGVLSVSMMATTFICAESVDVGFDKVKSFLFGNSEISEAGLDLNADEKVDIVDMIIAKGEFQAKASVEVAQLNYYAEVVADLAQYNLNEWETYKGAIDDCVISDDSDENKFIVNEVNECLSDYTNEKLSWSVTVENLNVTGVVCSLKEYDKKSGAFPNEIPQKMNIPYDAKNLKNAKDCSFSWSENMPEFIDPTKADMPDYAEKSVTQLNNKAKAVYNDVAYILTSYQTQGISDYPQGIVSSADFNEFISKINPDDMIDYSNLCWTAMIDKDVVTGVICTDKNEKSIGAYPNLVPMSMEIPYESDFVKNAGDIEFSWKKEYPQYISEDPEKADLPDYPEEYIFGLNDKAKKLCDNFREIILEYETQGKEIKDGLITSADDSEIADMLNDYAQSLALPEWVIKVENYDIKGIICSDFTDATGAYPNNVPYGLFIPYDTSHIDCASDKNAKWDEEYDKYVKNMPLTILLKNAIVNHCNSCSKELYTNISGVITEYLAEGIEIPQGIITYEDDTEFVGKVKELFTGNSELKWTAEIDGEYVKGCIVSSNNLLGAYPNMINNVFTDTHIKKVHLPYNSEYVVYAGDKEFKWETLVE